MYHSYFTIQNNKYEKKFQIEINKHKQALSQAKLEQFINNLVYLTLDCYISLYSHKFLDSPHPTLESDDCGFRNLKCRFVIEKFKEMGPDASP